MSDCLLLVYRNIIEFCILTLLNSLMSSAISFCGYHRIFQTGNHVYKYGFTSFFPILFAFYCLFFFFCFIAQTALGLLKLYHSLLNNWGFLQFFSLVSFCIVSITMFSSSLIFSAVSNPPLFPPTVFYNQAFQFPSPEVPIWILLRFTIKSTTFLPFRSQLFHVSAQ